jgi:hypothetical protein
VVGPVRTADPARAVVWVRPSECPEFHPDVRPDLPDAAYVSPPGTDGNYRWATYQTLCHENPELDGRVGP